MDSPFPYCRRTGSSFMVCLSYSVNMAVESCNMAFVMHNLAFELYNLAIHSINMAFAGIILALDKNSLVDIKFISSTIVLV